MTEQISSRKNRYIQHLRQLAADGEYRRENAEYLCDGRKLLDEAIDKGAEILSIVWRAEQGFVDGGEKIRQYTVPDELFDYISPMKNSPGPLFTLRMKHQTSDMLFTRAIVLENVQDPGNVGTVIRTAAAMGVDTLILCGACADVYSPKTVRATMGAIFRERILTLSIEEAVSLIRSNGIRLYAAALSDRAVDIRSIQLSNAAVAIGSEGRGLSPELRSLCDGELIIPMTEGSESLNAAVAASIVMWEMAR